MQIIDGRVRLRTEPLMRAWTTDLNPVFKDYISWYHMEPRLTIVPVEEVIAEANEADISKMVVCGGNREENEHILGIAKEYEAIIPVGGVSIKAGIREALRELRWIKDSGFTAVNFSPFMAKLDVNDKRLYPVYAHCELLGIPIIVHSSIHYWREASMWHGQPQHFDEIAVDFPELKLIMSHGGNGFGPTVLAVAQRHPNVYLEFSALNPGYMAPEFVTAANTYLRRKCIFGTDYPLIPLAKGVELWKGALREEVWEGFFAKNLLDALHAPPVPL